MAINGVSNTPTTNADGRKLIAGTLFLTTENGFEPQRTNNFELQITGLDTIKNAGMTSSNKKTNGYSQAIYNRLQNIADELVLSVKTGFSPKENVSTLEVPYGNSKVKFAGIPSYEDGTVAWNDYYDKDTELILKAWQSAAYNAKTGAVGDAADYKRTAYMTMYSPSGKVGRRWKLHGCWVSSVNGDDMSNESNAVRSLSATFVYDWAERLETLDSESSGI